MKTSTLLLLAVIAGAGYWYWRAKNTAPTLVDTRQPFPNPY